MQLKSTFKDAQDYLRLALRTYVTAHRVLDKYLACKMLVISSIMATDVLLSHYVTKLGSLTSVIPRSSSLQHAATTTHNESSYWARVKDLERLESAMPELTKTCTFSKNLKKLLEEILPIEGEGGVKQLLRINFKELLNVAQLYVLQVLKVLPDSPETSHLFE